MRQRAGDGHIRDHCYGPNGRTGSRGLQRKLESPRGDGEAEGTDGRGKLGEEDLALGNGGQSRTASGAVGRKRVGLS